jgi:transposase-like protein
MRLFRLGSRRFRLRRRRPKGLKTRGVNDVLIAVTDGLKGIGEAPGAVLPATTLQP